MLSNGSISSSKESLELILTSGDIITIPWKLIGITILKSKNNYALLEIEILGKFTVIIRGDNKLLYAIRRELITNHRATIKEDNSLTIYMR
jgi:hypothetical protein